MSPELVEHGNDNAAWQVGTNFNPATNGRESGANVYAQFSTDWASTSTWRVNGTTTTFAAGTAF
jgi:hypothetical protein